MHPSAMNFSRLFFETYGENLPAGSKIVDIGAQNVNGSIKDVCPGHYQYIGVDFVEAEGVEIILNDAYSFPFENESIDAIVCSSCFEHSEMFWLVFNEMLRILKPSGLIYINAPSNGYIHRWPVDCWRFYPDAGNALVTWAKRSGFDPVLLESFIGHRHANTVEGAWNDFVAVFAKSRTLQAQFKRTILQSLDVFDNASLPGDSKLHNFQQDPEDFRLIAHLREEKSALLDLQQQREEEKSVLLDLQQQLQSKLAEAQQQLALNAEQLAAARDDAINVRNAIQSIQQSTSWKVTGPLRLMSRALRGVRPLVSGGLRARVLNQIKPIYWAIPPTLRTPILHWGYRNIAAFFRGIPHYESWKNGGQSYIGAADNAMIAIDSVQPVEQINGSIAIHLHMFYHDLATEFAGYLNHMPFSYDLYVSVKDADGVQACRAAFSKLKQCKELTIKVVENRGRDIAPMFCTFGDTLRGYDFIAHLHSKKSLYNAGATEGWRQYLAGQLLGSPVTIRRIFSLLTNGKGIVYPQSFKSLPYQANAWLANKAMGTEWCARLGISPMPEGYFDFPVGSMFWARCEALQPLFNANINIEDFAEESGQTDGTFAHCLERLLVLSARKQGFEPGILKDMQAQSWSPWRLEQSTGRLFQSLVDQFSSSSIKCIGFDIFDTLLIRPLINAESTKSIVAASLPKHLAEFFREYRVAAESKARNLKGKDVDLVDIYQAFQQLTQLPDQDVVIIRALEENIEYKSLSARTGGVELFERAKDTGKPVVLISDMFLPKELITRALHANGIQGWSAFYLSNQVGLRKDSGQLYDHVLQTHQLRSHEMLMVGDNERSDFQIPCEKLIGSMHLLRPTELARGMPRMRRFVEQYEFSDDLNAELTLGLLFAKNFSAITYPNIKPASLFDTSPYNIGYSLVGPLLTSMSQWLIDTAASDGVDRLYFLAREGQLMKAVYDLWAQGVVGSPASEYLVVSRRACGVPLVQSIDDIQVIAKTDYYPNTAANYLLERFGLELDDDSWNNIQRDIGIGKDTQCEVRNENLSQVMPLLIKVAEAIFTQACEEREPLTRYLKSSGLADAQNSVVVDVGYGATIQNYLCQLTGKKIHGYYLATDARSINVSKNNNVIIRGCFMENVERNSNAPIMYLRSFELEKLLSSSDGQVVKYTSIDGVTVTAVHRGLSQKELGCDAFRNELRNGVLKFVNDAAHIRSSLLHSFSPSLEVSKALVSEFLSIQSSEELEMLSNLLLDDHFCGRGIL